MKKSGKHPSKTLTAAHVRNVSQPGRHADGNGLYLVVDDSGAKRWLLRTVVLGKRTDIGLGGLSVVSLAQARDEAARLRKLARDGGNPLLERRQAKRIVPTFTQAAETVHSAHKSSWKNGKHAEQWINTLKTYVFPVMGSKSVDRIETSDVLNALSPIWQSKPETARRVMQRIRAIMDWAKASGHRKGDNPVDGVTKALPKTKTAAEHHTALPYADVPRFLAQLRASDAAETVKLAFEFAILTAARTGEILGAQWAEFDTEAKTWTIPAVRMKAGREHRVPLGPRCLEILEHAKRFAGDNHFVFSGNRPNKPLSNMVFLMALRRLKVTATVHGFRSSFRDWASEQTNFPSAVCEAALAHTIRDKVEAAYHRTDLFERRRTLMDAWATHCSLLQSPVRTAQTAP